jgi:membrane protease YdiL (CAAX protease family)
MNFPSWFSPRFFSHQMEIFDAEAAQERAEKASQGISESNENSRVWLILGVACLCLLLVHYAKNGSSLILILPWLDSQLFNNEELWNAYKTSEYRSLYIYLWWGSIYLLGLLIIPMLMIRFWLKEPLHEYGWQWGSTHKHWQLYLLLALPIIWFAIIASYGDDFSGHYPFYKLANRSWFDLLAWEAIYITQFIAIEFFFRGYLVNGLRRKFGSLSIAVMCVPYLMIHFPKLWPESFGAILFGFFLGVLALKSRSIWGGVLVHIAIALTMDIAALIQTRGLPSNW